jgi:HK97 family phage major capsid protein
MDHLDEIKTAVDELAGTTTNALDRLTRRLDATERNAKAATDAADRIEVALNRLPLDARGGQPGAASTPETKAFGAFIRRGREALDLDEVKSLRVSDDTAGGYLAPEQFVAEVIKNVVQFSPVRAAARVGSTAAGSVRIPKRTGTPTAGWVSEIGSRPATQPAYGQVEIPVNEAACYVDVSNQLLEDSAVDIYSELSMDLAEEFGRLEGYAFVLGDGVGKPEGLMAADAVQYTPTGSASDVTSDSLITALYALAPFYRGRAAWMMNGTSLAAVRKMKDERGNYLWAPGLAPGQPETLLGRPVVEAVDMPDIGAGAFPIVVGDFQQAYRIYDRVQLGIIRDPYSVATTGLTRFHARRRVGGGVVKAEAIRKLKVATS